MLYRARCTLGCPPAAGWLTLVDQPPTLQSVDAQKLNIKDQRGPRRNDTTYIKCSTNSSYKCWMQKPSAIPDHHQLALSQETVETIETIETVVLLQPQ